MTGTVLQRLTERLDAGIMLHKGYFKTDPTSYARSRDNILFGAADWPARLASKSREGRTSPRGRAILDGGADLPVSE